MKNRKLKILALIALTSITVYGCGNKKEVEITENNESAVVENTETSDIILDNEEQELETLEQEEQIVEEPEEIIIEPEYHKVKLMMVGDNLIHSGLYKAAKQSDGSYNFDNMYENILTDIEEADLAIINQETIFTADRDNISSYPMFGSPTEVGDAEVKAGFDVIAHSTNHTVDKNLKGIKDTINFWETNYPEITYLGIHDEENESDVKYIEKNGIKLAFVNYTYGLNGLESWIDGNEYMVDMLTDTDIEETLAEAEENSDITVAILHVGNEYVYKPTEYAQEQVDRFIDNGADIVFCAHPHVVEPYEMRTTEKGNEGLVYYSLGNFISSQDEIPRIIGGMAKITVEMKVTGDEKEIYIKQYSMEPLVTHQENGFYTTFKLEDYTDELCSKHKLQSKKRFDCEYLWQFYRGIVESK